MTCIKTPEQLIQEVGEWSMANFGLNPYPMQIIPKPEDTFIHQLPVAMNELCSLMGLVEEFGELSKAILENNATEISDALGDIGIYLCDYCYRTETTFVEKFENWNVLSIDEIYMNLAVHIGTLYHAHLKRIQKIRGMDDPNKFKHDQTAAIQNIANELFFLCGKSWWQIVNETWENVVSSRDWKKFPKEGSPDESSGN